MGNVFQGNVSIKNLVKCGRITEAHQVFDTMPARDVYSWTALLSGYVKHGKAEEALNHFCHMQKESVEPNNVTFICALKACICFLSFDWGKEIHANIMEGGLESDICVGSTLIDMYAKCGSIQDALHVFSKLSLRNVVSWTAMVSGYVKQGLGNAALELFWQMQYQKVAPNGVTFASALTACGLIASGEQGQEIHQDVVCCGLESDCFVGNSLIDMYMKCGSIECARHTFNKIAKRDLVSWNTMIAGYANHGLGKQALQLFLQMLEKRVMPDKVTFLSSLKACAQLQDIEQGKQVYAYIKKSGAELDVVLGSAIVDMFAKCGSIESARQMFKLLPERDVVAWTAMISGFSHGDAEEALKLFGEMKQQKVLPDRLTFISVLNACACISDLENGERIHADVIASRLESDVCIGSSLVDMYAKCGSLHKAQEVFDALSERDIVAWNAMIVGYAQHGDCKGLHGLFKQMCKAGVKLDKVTYLSIFSACSHWGLVDDGHQLLDFMTQDYSSKPTAEHYTCMVDLLSRAGHLEEAEDVIQKMPFQPGAAVWMSLLGACRTYCNLEIATRAVERVQELEPQNATVPMCRFDDNVKVRQLM